MMNMVISMQLVLYCRNDIFMNSFLMIGTQEIYPHNYFISKINPNGELLWSTRPAPEEIENGLFVIANCLTFQGESTFMAGYSGKKGYIVVASFDKINGRMQWENKEIVSSNSHMFSSQLISDGVSIYLLGYSGFPKIKPVQEYQETNDFVMKINSTTGDVIWTHPMTMSSRHDLSLHPFTSVYNYISMYKDSSSLIFVYGQYHDFTTGGSFTIAQLLYTTNGSLYSDISNSNIHHKPEDMYTHSSYKLNSYVAQSAENEHYYGTDKSTLGSIILKNHCPDGYYLEPKSETTSIASHCRGITWSIQQTEDHYLTCSYIYGGVEATGLVMIYILPLLFSMISSYLSKISVLSTCLAIFATISFSADISYLTSQIFYNSFSFGMTLISFFLPIFPYAAYMRTQTRGRRYRLYLPKDPNLPRILFYLLYIRHVLFYFYLYCIGYLLYLLCLLPHPPVRDLLLSYLHSDQQQSHREDEPVDEENIHQTLESTQVSSKILTSSLLFTSISLILFSFVPTLVLQSLNEHLMSFADLETILPTISIVSKSLFMLTLINYIFYSYGMSAGTVLWSYIQTITTLSVFTVLHFQEMDEEEDQQDHAHEHKEGIQVQERSKPQSPSEKKEIEMYQQRIHELESQLQQMTAQSVSRGANGNRDEEGTDFY